MPRERESILGVFVGQLGEVVEDFHGLPFANPILVSDGGGDLRFGECFSHSLFS